MLINNGRGNPIASFFEAIYEALLNNFETFLEIENNKIKEAI